MASSQIGVNAFSATLIYVSLIAIVTEAMGGFLLLSRASS